MFRFRLAILFLGSSFHFVCAQLPSPAISTVFPPAAVAGSSIDITLSGRDLDACHELVFSHPGIVATVKKQAATEFEPEKPIANQFKVEVADNVPVGKFEVRALGRFGLSSSASFWVTDRNSVLVETGNNHSRDKPMPIPKESLVFGRSDANAIDHFQFKASKGQNLLVEVLAAEFESKLRPVVSLFNSQGKRLGYSKSSAESNFLVAIPADGEYTISIHDHIYTGGGEHLYGLSVTAAPRIELILPIAGQAGKANPFTIFGHHLPGGEPSDLTVNGIPLQKKKVSIYLPAARHENPLDPLNGTRLGNSFSFQLQSTMGRSNRVPIELVDRVVATEQEPNDQKHPQIVSIPADISGHFYPKRDQDWFRFAAKKGQNLVVDVVGNRFGAESDPMVFVWQVHQDGNGKETLKNINVTDDVKHDNGRYTRTIPHAFNSSHNDPSVRFTAPQDGDYCVNIRDSFGNALDQLKSVYRISIREAQPDFQLFAWSQRFRRDGNNVRIERGETVLRPGETVAIPVDLVRESGFSADVQLQLRGIPEAISTNEVWLKGNATEANILLTAAEDAKSFHGPIQIVGITTLNGKQIKKDATYVTFTSDSGNVASQKARGRITRDLMLSIVGQEKAPAIVAVQNSAFTTSIGGTFKVPLKFVANDKMKGDTKLKFFGLPGQVKPPEVVLKPDTKDVNIDIKVPDKKTPPGTYNVYLTGQGIAIHQRDKVAVQTAEAAKKDFETVLASLVSKEQELTKDRDAKRKVRDDLKSKLDQIEQESKLLTENSEKIQQNLDSEKAKLASAIAANQADSSLTPIKAAIQAAEKQVVEAGEKLSQSQEKVKHAKAEWTAAEKQFTDVETALKAATEKKQRGEKHKKTLEDRFNNINKANAAKDLPLVLTTPLMKFTIVSSPIELTPEKTDITVPQQDGEREVKINLAVQRNFGFADAVHLSAIPPKGKPGLSNAQLQIAKDKTTGAITLKIGADAKPGSYVYSLQSKLKFGGVDLQHSTELKINVL